MKHEIIYTEHYALILGDEQTKENDWGYIRFQGGDVKLIGKYFADDWLKVIAHRPLTDAPVLEGVPLLPEWNVCDEELLVPFPNSTQTGRLRDGSEIKTWMLGWEEGFKEAKETYKYTEKDLINLVEKGHEIYNNGLGVATDAKKQKLIDFSLSLQQSKRPEYFETVCDCQECGANKTNLSLDMGCENKMAKTTNSQGQTELVGEYSYE
jgi:hypothetical protein